MKLSFPLTILNRMVDNILLTCYACFTPVPKLSGFSILNSGVILSIRLQCFILHWLTKIRSESCGGFHHAVRCRWMNNISCSADASDICCCSRSAALLDCVEVGQSLVSRVNVESTHRVASGLLELMTSYRYTALLIRRWKSAVNTGVQKEGI